ncbi:uncharacterized protein DS421_13g406690 [Arachis hypogaea]|nr:uncharacterized protein DS421_13g406690 [Arachis hypogaea]
MQRQRRTHNNSDGDGNRLTAKDGEALLSDAGGLRSSSLRQKTAAKLCSRTEDGGEALL